MSQPYKKQAVLRTSGAYLHADRSNNDYSDVGKNKTKINLWLARPESLSVTFLSMYRSMQALLAL